MLVDLSCEWNFQKFAFVRASFKLPIQWLTYNVITGAYLPSKLRVKYCVIGKRYRCPCSQDESPKAQLVGFTNKQSLPPIFTSPIYEINQRKPSKFYPKLSS